MFYVWWPFVTWSWPWTELNIKHLLNQCLALYFRSTRSKFWPKTDNFEVSTARNLKAPILTFDLTLTWHVTSFGKFRGCFRIVSSRAFERRIGRLSAAIRSRVMTWGRLTPLPSKSRVAKYPSKCRVKGPGVTEELVRASRSARKHTQAVALTQAVSWLCPRDLALTSRLWLRIFREVCYI